MPPKKVTRKRDDGIDPANILRSGTRRRAPRQIVEVNIPFFSTSSRFY